MACIQPDGRLSGLAQKVLAAIAEGAGAAEAAKVAGVPLFRVRASLRELVDAGLLTVDGDRWALTDAGTAARQA